MSVPERQSKTEERIKRLIERCKDLLFALAELEHRECCECMDIKHENDMVLDDTYDEWRCVPCHEDMQAETGGDFGCPGCEGGVPANCVCGREN